MTTDSNQSDSLQYKRQKKTNDIFFLKKERTKKRVLMIVIANKMEKYENQMFTKQLMNK